jgi:PPM family protein phosphatase
VILLGGGVYGAWWYNQQQYYVGVHDGYVAIFRGTNQSVAGISLSSLLSPSTLQVNQLGTNDQTTISQTIAKSSVSDAEALITQLQSGADQCHTQWTALASWQTQTVKYHDELVRAEHSKPKITVPASDAPGTMPAVPDTANCAPAAAFGIAASALPAQAGGTAAAVPTTSPTPKPSATAKKSATPRATK